MRNLSFTLLCALATSFALYLSPAPAANAPVAASPGAEIRAVDGDTIEIDAGGERTRVRYLLIDTPELHHPSRPVEELGEEALQLNRKLLAGGISRMEYDRERTDRYGRSLAYVFAVRKGREVMVNEELAASGLALPMIINPNRRYSERILGAIDAARSAGRGLWGLGSLRTFTAAQAWSEAPYLAGAFITLRLTVERRELSRNRLVLRQGRTSIVAYRGRETEGIFSVKEGDRVVAVGKLVLSYAGCEMPLGSDLQLRLEAGR